MNIFGMGTFEIVMILLVATLVLGPNKIPQLAKQLGNFLRSFRKITGEMAKDFTKAIDAGDTKTSGTKSGSSKLEDFLSGKK